MGYYTSPKSRGIKYLMTRAAVPFCAYPYIAEITVSVLEKKTAGEILFWFEADSKNATAPMSKYGLI